MDAILQSLKSWLFLGECPPTEADTSSKTLTVDHLLVELGVRLGSSPDCGPHWQLSIVSSYSWRGHLWWMICAKLAEALSDE